MSMFGSKVNRNHNYDVQLPINHAISSPAPTDCLYCYLSAFAKLFKPVSSRFCDETTK